MTAHRCSACGGRIVTSATLIGCPRGALWGRVNGSWVEASPCPGELEARGGEEPSEGPSEEEAERLLAPGPRALVTGPEP
jgi:hypothetical protein